MPDQALEYVASVDGLAGPRGSVIAASAWKELSASERENFVPRVASAKEN